MSQAMETIHGFVTAVGATLTALTMAAGDSLNVKNVSLDKRVALIQAWEKAKAAAILRIRSPRLFDGVQGLRYRPVSGVVYPLMAVGSETVLYPGDALTVEASGSAVGGAIENTALTLLYDDLPGTSQRLISWDDVLKRARNFATQEVSITAGAAGGYSGAAAINASFDLLKAGADYAVLGIEVSALCASICFRGPDTGGLRLAVPGQHDNKTLTGAWFKTLSEHHNRPLIPVINWSNKAATFVDVVQDDGGAAVVATFNLVELAPA